MITWAVIRRAARTWWVRALITAVILFYLSRQIDMREAAQAVLRISLPHLVLVLGLVAVDRVVMIGRWLLLLRASGTRISTAAAARIVLISSFVGSFLPAGVGGDAARAWGLARHTSEGSEALASVAVDRLLGVLSLVVIGALGAAAWAPVRGAGWTTLTLVAVVLVGSLGVFWADRLVRAVVPIHQREGGVARRVLKVGDAVGRYRSRGSVLALVMFWSLAVQVLRIAQAYVLGLGLGLAVPFSYYLLFMPIGLLMLLLPISVSGFGLPQGVIVWLLRPTGVPDEQSFALSALIVLTGLMSNLPGLWLWLAFPKGEPAR